MSKILYINNESISFSNCYDFDEIFTYKHLRKSYRNCKKGVNWKASTHKFTANAPYNITKLYNALHSGEFKSYGFSEFDINERGHQRHIRSVKIEERIVQRCLCDYSIVPVLSKSFIYDNGACLKNKGYEFTVSRIKCHLHKYFKKYGNEGYILLFDFTKFFDTLPHNEIKSILRNTYKDERILKLVFHFIDMFGDCGLGLGSQVSQILALSAGNKLDHYIKEQLHIQYYGRYMDDGYLISNSKEELEKCYKLIEQKCSELGLNLNLEKTHIVKLNQGFTFLKIKFNITDTGKIITRISKDSVVRMRRKLTKLKKRLSAGLIEFADVETMMASWNGHAKRFNSYITRQSMKTKYNDLFKECDTNVLQSHRE